MDGNKFALRLPVLFLASTVIPGLVVAWLGWRLIEQDKALDRQRQQDRLENAADQITASLARSLEALPDSRHAPGENVLAVAFVPGGVRRLSGAPLVFAPAVARPLPPGTDFGEAERLEFAKAELEGAAARYAMLSRSQSHALRAGALLRMGRVLRKLKKFSQASSAYASLIALGNEPVAGAPAALVGRHALASLKDEAGDKEGARQQARLLREDLVTGAWTIDRATYEFHRSSVQDWLGVEALFNVEEEILAAAIEQAWKRRSEAIKGSASLWLEGRPVVLAWDRNGAVAAGPKWLAARCQEWRTRQQQVDFSVIDAGGHLACGSPGGGQPWAIRAASETKLPWAVRVHGSQFAQNQWDTRRRLLLAGLALMVLVTLGGGYATQRAARREFAVARLKSDFVAAVSHEFRSPLTAMRHMVELLEEGTVFSEEKRRRYYSVLGKETDRLHRLVESLLNFGRMEAGQQHYQLSPQDAGELVYQTVRDFQGGLRGAGSLTVETSGVLMVRADAEALRCALWNLLDNAVKYSPFVAPLEAKVEVSVQRQHGKVGIIVKDHGAGIAPAEQKEIFGKFVRGSGAQASGVKGTGIGLAMVEHIIRAHGGEIRLQSELGLGSVFTILLPAYEEPV